MSSNVTINKSIALELSCFALKCLVARKNVKMMIGLDWTGRMKKGPAYHWDLMVVAILNGVLAFFGLGWNYHGLDQRGPDVLHSVAE